jgi:acyl-CoA synthetase (AMP-forming)/AMP-acid ligase II/acyl carrier protein
MHGSDRSSILRLLERQETRIPDAPAILAPGRPLLTYRRLYQHVEVTGRALRAMGVGPHDRLAVALPNGPEMAAAIVAVAAWSACAPLNPAYAAEELDCLLMALRPRALLTQAGMDSPARRAAAARDLPVVELSVAPGAEAGLFTLSGGPLETASPDGAGESDDVALLLLTSGTTARSKIVPLTHTNVCTSAGWWREALALTDSDRCVNVLPLFHGHGLIATVLASLEAGASIVFTPGCEADRFFGLLSEFRPTWYSAVPTMHQAILAQAGQHRARAAECPLRFIRSASAPLPIPVLAELERTFQAPVIEFYGMTEAASAPIACNPLPPRQRKAGSVGIRVGLDVAIVDEGGATLAEGETGEVAVRGPSVMRGYDGESTACQPGCAGGWFRTGDLGFLDPDGHLFLTGRSKEIINRGGEKVSPREVDDALMGHPAVAQAVTFAVSHATLGEDVAAAVVLRPGSSATANDIRRFAIGRLAAFKVPRQVLIVPELPAGPTGKLQRLGLAARLGLATSAAGQEVLAAPRTPFEEVVASLWVQLLDLERVGIHDDFFALGGDSLLATQLLARLHDALRVEVAFSAFFEAPTVADLARNVEAQMQAGPGEPIAAIVPVPRDRALPASIAQDRLWHLEQLLPEMPFFNILYVLRLTGSLNLAALERSLNEIVRRHEILRTTFSVVDGRPVGSIAPTMPMPLALDDLHALPELDKEATGHQLVGEEALRVFDLARGPLLRARLLHWAEHEHLLILTTHQVIADGWSLGVLTSELAALYEAFSAGEPSPLPALSIQYADFASWQQDWPCRAVMGAQLAYWREQLRDPLPVLELATDHPRRATLSLRTARQALALPATLSEAVQRFSHQEGSTVFMALVAALKMLLHCYLGQDDLRVATPVANRHRPGTEALIGPLANTVILRTDLGGDPTAREVLRRVRGTTLAAYANQDLPLEELARVLQRDRGLQPTSLSSVMIILQNVTLRPRTRPGRTLSFQEANPSMLLPLVAATTFDLVLMLDEGPHELRGSCVYKADLFEGATIARMLGDFQFVLEGLVRQPQQSLSATRRLLNERSSDSEINEGVSQPSR